MTFLQLKQEVSDKRVNIHFRNFAAERRTPPPRFYCDFAAEACRRQSNAALRRRSYAADYSAASSVDEKMREPHADQLVQRCVAVGLAQLCASRDPTEPAIRLLPQPLDLRRSQASAVPMRGDPEPLPMNSIISLTELPTTDHPGNAQPAGSSRTVLDAVLDVAIRLLLRFLLDIAQTDEPPLSSVRGRAMRLRFISSTSRCRRQHIERGGGGPSRSVPAPCQPAASRQSEEATTADRHVEQRI